MHQRWEHLLLSAFWSSDTGWTMRLGPDTRLEDWGQITTFVNLFGNQPGEPASSQDFEATLDQTLFLRNGGVVRTWLTPNGDNLAGRLLKLKDAPSVAEELYLTAFARRPTADEQKLVADFLARHEADRATALPELAWALLSSAEFRFNH